MIRRTRCKVFNLNFIILNQFKCGTDINALVVATSEILVQLDINSTPYSWVQFNKLIEIILSFPDFYRDMVP